MTAGFKAFGPGRQNAPGRQNTAGPQAGPGVQNSLNRVQPERAQAERYGAAQDQECAGAAGMNFSRRLVLRGIAVSAGIGIGQAFFPRRRLPRKALRRRIPAQLLESETRRLYRAIDQVAADFSEVRHKIPRELSEQAAIIDAHIMICRDPKLAAQAVSLINSEHMSAELALEESTAKICATFNSMTSDYLRERARDVMAVSDRIIARLVGEESKPQPEEPHILISHDLTPADALALFPERILAIATEMGGQTAHTGILARSLQIPCVVGVTGLEEAVLDGDLIIVDGLQGQVVLNPLPAELEQYQRLRENFTAFGERIRKNARFPAETEDGFRLAVYANLEIPDEAASLDAQGAEGVGLFRTEFGFMYKEEPPTEQELYADYKFLLEAARGRPVVFRTLDLGADKIMPNAKNLEEPNPALGLRSIRFCLRHQDIFRRQLRAILRAGAHGNAAIMFPLISGLGELQQAKSILNEVRQELEAEGQPFARDLPLGIMIELPSAVFIADYLAKEVDFFSIGTNDLIQYALGIDRNNKHVAYLYQPLHPAIIRAIRYTVDMAHRAGITVCLCGEMASDPHCLPVLLAIGVDALSVTPQAIPAIKHIVRHSNAEECNGLLQQISSLGSSRQISRLLRQTMDAKFAGEKDFFVSGLEKETS